MTTRDPRFVLLLALLATTACCLQACATGPQISDSDLRFISKASLANALHAPVGTNGKQIKLALVDVRAPEAYAKGHIPGAINIPLRDLKPNDSRLTSADLIVVYANGWEDPESAAAAKQLIAMGYQNVREFRGGIEAWQHH